MDAHLFYRRQLTLIAVVSMANRYEAKQMIVISRHA